MRKWEVGAIDSDYDAEQKTTFRYLPIQAVLLLPGIISVTMFSYLHLSYYGKASEGGCMLDG
jgi:hypothetical protein